MPKALARHIFLLLFTICLIETTQAKVFQKKGDGTLGGACFIKRILQPGAGDSDKPVLSRWYDNKPVHEEVPVCAFIRNGPSHDVEGMCVWGFKQDQVRTCARLSLPEEPNPISPGQWINGVYFPCFPDYYVGTWCLRPPGRLTDIVHIAIMPCPWSIRLTFSVKKGNAYQYLKKERRIDRSTNRRGGLYGQPVLQ